MTVLEIVKASLRKIQAYASGEEPETTDLADAITALQIMLRGWAGRKILVFASVTDTLTLVSSTSTYTWGESASYNINSAPPNQVEKAYVVDSSGRTHSVDIIAKTRYAGIANKLQTGRPVVICIDYTFPAAGITVFPVPVEADTLYLESFKPFTETSSFDLSGSTLKFPKHYEEAIVYNLAIRLASEYGKAIPQEVADVARDSYEGIIRINAANRIDIVDLSSIIPAGCNTNTYNISEG